MVAFKREENYEVFQECVFSCKANVDQVNSHVDFFCQGVPRFFLCACVCSRNIYPVAHYVNCRFIRNTSIRLTQQLHMKLTLEVLFNVKCILLNSLV